MKSAHQAIKQVRDNCYRYDWVIDMDISKFFDEIDHELMLRAVAHTMEEKWVLMYVKRWLEAPIVRVNGQVEQRNGKGTPQGGVISPLLANLYLHFTLDAWLSKHYPDLRFVRYADDIVIHCKSKAQAEEVLSTVRKRLAEVKLKVKEEKTRIAYCKDYRRKEKHEHVQFEFLGFSYQPRARLSNMNNRSFTAFSAELSQSSQKKIRDEIKQTKPLRNTQLPLIVIAKSINEKLRGWINYYGLFGKRQLREAMQHLDDRLIKLTKKKHHLGTRKATAKLKVIKQENPNLFYHWATGYSTL